MRGDSGDMNAPAGWYPTPEGKLRYWDGLQWTAHFASAPPVRPSTGSVRPYAPAVNVARAEVGSSRGSLASWFGWGGLVLLALLGAASSGVSGFLAMTGVYVLVVALVALFRGHVDWAWLRSRAAAGAALAAALVLTTVAGATAGPTPQAPTAAPATRSTAPTAAPSSTQPSATTSPTHSLTPTPTATPTPTPSPSPTAPAVPAAAKGTALAAVATLTVKGRAPKTGYSREAFGQPWYDADRNGCDTRNDVLRRDLKSKSMKNSCKVLAGTLKPDPYIGQQVRFVYGGASEVDIDHVVALSDAWQKGAAGWAAGKRVKLANDPLNLLSVAAGANRAKGDGDAATWLPPNKSFRCAYVARQVAVKARYGVWVTAAERDAMVRVLRTCPTQKLPVSKAIALGGGTIVATPSAPRTTPPAPKKPSPHLDPQFSTCREANAAGYGPYREGTDPEYHWYQDRDHDGLVCER